MFGSYHGRSCLATQYEIASKLRKQHRTWGMADIDPTLRTARQRLASKGGVRVSTAPNTTRPWEPLSSQSALTARFGFRPLDLTNNVLSELVAGAGAEGPEGREGLRRHLQVRTILCVFTTVTGIDRFVSMTESSCPVDAWRPLAARFSQTEA